MTHYFDQRVAAAARKMFLAASRRQLRAACADFAPARSAPALVRHKSSEALSSSSSAPPARCVSTPLSLGGIVRVRRAAAVAHHYYHHGVVATSFSNTSCEQPPAAAPLPVGIFVDLDNIAQETKTLSTHTREEAARFVRPLRQFAEAAGELVGRHRTKGVAKSKYRSLNCTGCFPANS